MRWGIEEVGGWGGVAMVMVGKGGGGEGSHVEAVAVCGVRAMAMRVLGCVRVCCGHAHCS